MKDSEQSKAAQLQNKKKEWKRLLADGKIPQLLDQLKELLFAQSSNFDFFVHTSSRFKNIKWKQKLGTLSSAELELEYNKVTASLLSLINEITVADIWSDQASNKKAFVEKAKNLRKKISVYRIIDGSVTTQDKISFKKFEKLGENYSGLIAIDLDDFTQINNKYGIKVGDEIIHRITTIIIETFKELDLKYYLLGVTGRDEFLIFMPVLGLERSKLEILFNKIKNYDWSNLHRELHVSMTMSITNRESQKQRLEIYEDAEIEKTIKLERIDSMIIRALWGIKNGKLSGKNKIVESPKKIPISIKPVKHMKKYYGLWS